MKNGIFLIPIYKEEVKEKMREVGTAFLIELLNYQDFLVEIFGEFQEGTFGSKKIIEITDSAVCASVPFCFGPSFVLTILGEKGLVDCVILYNSTFNAKTEVSLIIDGLRKKYKK